MDVNFLGISGASMILMTLLNAFGESQNTLTNSASFSFFKIVTLLTTKPYSASECLLFLLSTIIMSIKRIKGTSSHCCYQAAPLVVFLIIMVHGVSIIRASLQGL